MGQRQVPILLFLALVTLAASARSWVLGHIGDGVLETVLACGFAVMALRANRRPAGGS